MPMHDWTRVEAGIFHALHHRWISAISDELNTALLSQNYYALPEQLAADLGPDLLTLRDHVPGLQAEEELYRLNKSSIAVRHMSGDRLVAMIEIASPGNKANCHAFRAFVDKACELLGFRIHLLLIDPFPRGRNDPNGIHGVIWEAVEEKPLLLPADKPLTLVAYECGLTTRAYIEPVAVGDRLPDMPVFLEPEACVTVPLEATYQVAFTVLPRRWRRVLEASPGT
jgi:hypothetical protein